MSKTFNNSIIKVKNAEGKFEGLLALRGLDSYELAKANGFKGTEEEWMESIIGDGWVGAFQEVSNRVDALENSTNLVKTLITVEVASFVSNSTYSDYPYRASIPIEKVTSLMISEVIFNVEDAISGRFSPVSETYDGGVYIYATSIPEENINIPTIIIWR